MPPPREAAVIADNPGSSDRVGAPESDRDVWDEINEIYPTIHSDPTGRAALRSLQKDIGWFEDDARVEVRIKSPSRGDIIIHLNNPIDGYVAAIITKTAETPLPKTRSGRGYNARLDPEKKNTPGNASVAKQESHSEGHTKKNP